MTCSVSVVLAVCVGAAQPSAEPKSRGPDPAARSGSPDYKVVFWFNGSDWKHQVYDARKGQYTRAVEDWVRRNQFGIGPSGYVVPGRMATVRDIVLEKESGTTEQEKLQSAIRREEALILGKGAPGRSHPSPSPRINVEALGRVIPPSTGQLGSGRPPGQASPLRFPRSSGSPFPYPYPRPHP